MTSKPESLVALTIGHSTRTIEEFVGLLQAHAVTRAVDVRTVPRSRHNPQFNRDTLPASLKTAAIGYMHMAELGGLRRTTRDSINTGWRNASFRGYADYMQTAEFNEAIEGLIQLMSQGRIAVMCAEAVPWRCHRSLIADALLVRGIRSEEIVSPTRTRVHVLTPLPKWMAPGSFIRKFLDASNDKLAGYIIPPAGQSSHSHSCARKKSTEV